MNRKLFFLVKIILSSIYIFAILLLFQDRVVYFDIFVANILTTLIILWLGPFRMIGGKYKLYSPIVVFFLGLFYYMFKGFGFALGENTALTSVISYSDIRKTFVELSLYLLISAIIISVLYDTLIFQKRTKRTNQPVSFRVEFGYYLLLFIGITSFVLLLRSMHFQIFEFLLHPNMRGYMNSEEGIGGGFGFFYYYGFQMLGIASIVKLSIFGVRKRKPSITWYISSLVYTGTLFVLAPRATLISYIVSVLIVYHNLIKKINTRTILVFLIACTIYIYGTNIWRGIVGSMNNPTVVSAAENLRNTVDFSTYFEKILLGRDLSDIRVFTLVHHTYGNTLDFKYGSTLTRIITQFIPRFLWANKPLDLGIEIAQLIYPGTKSGIPPGFFGEMYMNFGNLGFILGTLFIGLCLNWVSSFLEPPSSINRFLFFAIITPKIFLLHSNSIGNLLGQIIISFIGLSICLIKWRKRSDYQSSQIKFLSTRIQP